MPQFNPEDFSADKYDVPVLSRLSLYLPIAGSRPEAMRVSERVAIKEGDRWYEVELFSPRIERWIEQKTHATEVAAVMDALGWYPQPVFATISSLGFTLEQGGGGVEAWRLERGDHYVYLTTPDGTGAKDLDASANELSLGYYKVGQDHSDPIVEVSGNWDLIKGQVEFFATGDWVPPSGELNADHGGIIEHPSSVPRWTLFEYADKAHSDLYYWKDADQISSDFGFETLALADKDAINERRLRAVTEMPEGATDFTDDGFKTVYYRRFNALNMNLLEQHDGKDWQVASYLPWKGLRALAPASDTPAPVKPKSPGM
jgi:hypothetical protein